MLVRAVHGIDVDEPGMPVFAEAHADSGFGVDPDFSVNEIMPLGTKRTLDLKDFRGPNAYCLAGDFYGSAVLPYGVRCVDHQVDENLLDLIGVHRDIG